MACDQASQIERGIILFYHAMDIFLCALLETCYPHIAALRNVDVTNMVVNSESFGFKLL